MSEVADKFDYNAPQFIDFVNFIDDDQADKYFEQRSRVRTDHATYESDLQFEERTDFNVMEGEGKTIDPLLTEDCRVPCSEEETTRADDLPESRNAEKKTLRSNGIESVEEEQTALSSSVLSTSNSCDKNVSGVDASKENDCVAVKMSRKNGSMEAKKNETNRRSVPKNCLGNLSNVSRGKTPPSSLQPKATLLSAQRQKLLGKENRGSSTKTTPSDQTTRSTYQRNSVKKHNMSDSKPSRLKPPSPSLYGADGRRRSLSCDSLPLRKLPTPRQNNSMKLRMASNSRRQASRPVPVKALPLRELQGCSAKDRGKMSSCTSSMGSQDSLSSSSTKSTGRRRSFSAQDPRKDVKEKFISMAEAVIHFQKDTPQRFHSRPRTDRAHQDPASRRGRAPSPQPTIPYSPCLTAKNRHRPVNALSQAQKEELELEEIRKHQVKAHPINEGIFKHPKPPKKIEMKPVTVPKPFNLTEVKNRVVEPEEAPVRFVARPVPKNILERPCGIGEKKEISLTVPKSPMMKLKDMAAKCHMKIDLEVDNDDRTFKSRAVPHFGIPFIPHQERKMTQVMPFSFEMRNKELILKKEQKIQEYLEEEKRAREFRANPMPSFESPDIPERNTMQITKPKPFNLATNQFHREEKAKESEQEEKVQFQARPAVVLERPPFKPKLPENHSLQYFDFQLNTEKRAQERQAFDEMIKQKESELEAARRERQRRLEEEEKEEIARLRREMVRKAQPVRHFVPVVPAPSEKPLTDPHTPKFSSRFQK